MSARSYAEALFASARRAGRARQLWANLRGQSRRLLDLNTVAAASATGDRRAAGTQTVISVSPRFCCFATIFRNRQKAEKRKWGLVFPPAPTAPSGSGLRALFGPEPLRVTALTGAVLDRSGVAALLRTEVLRWSAALLGMSIADVNLAARSPSSSLPAPVRRFPYPRAPQSPHPRSAPDVLWVPCSSVSLRARPPSTS